MNKLAIVAIAAAAFTAAPALAQSAPRAFSGPNLRTPTPYAGAYGLAPGPSFFRGRVYSRERDIATEPDPNVRLELRREQNLNPGIYQ